MTIRTVLRYLIGDRQAILELASSRWTLVIGLLFVLSAGFAREYDGEDLLSEPWHLVLPLGASLISSFVLFCVAYCGRFDRQERRPAFREAYLSFLGLFWMTAPLAWAYAIPYERFLSPLEATRANLLTLGLVSLWRVVLMVRVLVVIFGYAPWAAAGVVLLFADTVALVALLFVPMPILNIMGGIRLSPSRSLLFEVACAVLQFGGCSWFVWFLLAVSALISSRLRWRPGEPSAETVPRPSLFLWSLAVASLGVWAGVLPITQPEQQLRSRVERLFREDRIAEAVAEMSAHPRNDFPPHWEPPPRQDLRFFNREPWHQLLKVYRELTSQPTAAWVREFYLGKLRDVLRVNKPPPDDDLDAWADLLPRLPETDDLLRVVEEKRRRLEIRKRQEKDTADKEDKGNR